ncbi:Hypothetical predicted protein [Paramuricea clavata]|uniref:Uncharacterized protein n=1 Tax=Paramuricea clavata TaxID=317549 RepID=A0A6S7FQY8_PARCT|nr:Hypothetical predicted protein [Paramuricea clavata]
MADTNVFAKQHCEITKYDVECVRKWGVSKRITHIIDCEGYSTPRSKIFLREVSVWCRQTKTVLTYHIYMPKRIFYEKHKCVQYQINKIHGLPITRCRDGRDIDIPGEYYLYDEVLTNLRRVFWNADLIGYKGGIIERDLLRGIGYDGVNLELLECPRYETLLTKYGARPHTCGKHFEGYKYHCSGHEVVLFGRYLTEYAE